ncbi:uncharacterized protein LOC127256109 [Andrographis paniculata]|uniref:uncharacterized protein LOC127256109 n=1 Tax=Andrographis paniculata TaxID=175694 RepID=UPI0021E76828|nr:uncharacterized protein LOC127256109 [Andrographis paniculata]
MPPVSPPLPDFSRTKRLVLLVDLYPFLTLQDPTPYLRAVTAVASRLLRFPPISESLSAYKLFFSSLSPIRSAAVLPPQFSLSSLSFNRPSQTLDSLCNSLNSISSVADWPNSRSCPRASYTASSLLQLIHSSAWDKEDSNLPGEENGDFFKIPSNLVFLISPISSSVNSLADYLEFREFDEVFSCVNDAFVARDIHLCFIDIKIEEQKIKCMDEKNRNSGIELNCLKEDLRKFGWGFCSSDVIVLGSALLPLCLIYPKIGMSFDIHSFGDFHHRGELSLEILDVNSKPLECKCCDLEFLSMSGSSSSIKNDDILNASAHGDSQSSYFGRSFWADLGKENAKLLVKSIYRYEQCGKIGGSRETVLVREPFHESGKNTKKSDGNILANRVLEILQGEMGGVSSNDQLPIWQIFLSFLHVKGYWAMVALSGKNGDTVTGCLKPFTTHLALIDILDADAGCVSIGDELGSKFSKIDDDKIRDTCDAGMIDSNSCFGSQTDTSTSGNCEPHRDRKMTKSQRRLYQEMTWSSFCKAAFGGTNFDLFELYMARYYEKSKKLKFLKCWMKQIGSANSHCLKTSPGTKFEVTSSSNASPWKPSPAKDGAMPIAKPETAETFFNNLSERIQQGLTSGKDLQNLAERVVKSSIHWLQHKFNTQNNCEDQQLKENPDGSDIEYVIDKLAKILLKTPKEMKKIHQDFDPCSSSENIVREYEFQILLRMEIMQSDLSAVTAESRKQKMLKQICALLEIVQYLVAGGFQGPISLYDYVERTIKARYSAKLEDIVEKIYAKMDLLPFGDEDEAPSHLFNSEDSNQSWRDKPDKTERRDAGISQSVSTEGDSSHPIANPLNNSERIGEDEHAMILNEARERRERARRTARFVSKARDLQRVWAPKHSKMSKGKHDSLTNKSKRNKNRLPTSSYSVVCETPMSGNKRSRLAIGETQNDSGKSPFPVSRALFQDS